MKLASKILIIISMVAQGILVFPVILGIFALKKLNSAKTVKELRGWAIITLLFLNAIAGILMLVMKDEDLAEESQDNTSA